MKKISWPRLRLPQWRRQRQEKVSTVKKDARQKKASLATRIIVGYLILIVIMVGIGAYTYVGMQKVMAQYRIIVDQGQPYLLVIKDINTTVTAQLAAQRAYLLTGEDQYVLRAQLDSNGVKGAINKALDLAGEAEEKNLLNQVQKVHSELDELQERAFSAYAEGNKESAIETALLEIDSVQKRLAANFNILQGINERRVNDARDNANAAATQALTVSLILITVGTVIGFASGGVIARRTVNPLRQLAQATEKIVSGDLTTVVEIKGRDEVAQLAQTFQAMVKHLAQIIGGVRTSVQQIGEHAQQLTTSSEETTRATEQIASSIQEVAEGAEKQVGETSHVASVVEQMSQAMNQVAENAQTVATSSQNTAGLAEQGSAAIRDVIQQNDVVSQSMVNLSQLISELGRRSGEIGQIVEVITGIADQTNLLALNAAIEAARAGEAGKGFANKAVVLLS